jgi:thymidylate kinase
MAEPGLAPLIAIVGADGSGKSTLAADLLETLRAEGRRVELCYLGLGTGDLGNRIKAWPLVGRAFERTLSRKADQARDKDAKIPGLATALVISRLSRIRAKRFRRMLALRRAGVTVLTDRYPQTEVPALFEGPGLSAARAESGAIRRLAARERALYQWMASYVPDLVIRLNVDVETALARKPDHARALIERKVAVVPHLTFNGAPIVDLDATRPYAEVKAAAWAAVEAALAQLSISRAR